MSTFDNVGSQFSDSINSPSWMSTGDGGLFGQGLIRYTAFVRKATDLKLTKTEASTIRKFETPSTLKKESMTPSWVPFELNWQVDIGCQIVPLRRRTEPVDQTFAQCFVLIEEGNIIRTRYHGDTRQFRHQSRLSPEHQIATLRCP